MVYKTYNPIDSIYFPKCPFKEATGIKCPGCGAQRAIHYLLNFELLNAAKQNTFLILSIPYIALGVLFDTLKTQNESFFRWRKILFGQKAIGVVLTLLIIFWVLRNLI